MAYVGNVPQIGQYRKMDDLTPQFDGLETTFNITVGGIAVAPPTAYAMMVVLAGNILNPDIDFSISASTISFANPPAPLTTFFGIIMGDTLYTGTPSDATVVNSKLAPASVSYDKFNTTLKSRLLADTIIFGV
jgi:hypothetical protein